MEINVQDVYQGVVLGREAKETGLVEGESWTEMQSQSTNLMINSGSGNQNCPKFGQGEQMPILLHWSVTGYELPLEGGRILGQFSSGKTIPQRRLRAQRCLPAALPGAEGINTPFLERGLGGQCSIYHIELQKIELTVCRNSWLHGYYGLNVCVPTKIHTVKPQSPV